MRDAFACKPAVVAETDDYVAIASEFRSLAHLPGVRHATLFEPKPEEIYSWKRAEHARLRPGARRPLRELNRYLHRDAVGAGVTRVQILNPDGAHSIAVRRSTRRSTSRSTATPAITRRHEQARPHHRARQCRAGRRPRT